MATQKPIRSVLINVLIFIFIGAIITVIATSNSVFAQNTGPDGPVNNSTPGTSPSASQGDGLTEVNVPITQLSNTGDGLPQGMDSGSTSLQTEDPFALDNIQAVFSYYQLIGVSFNPRTSATTFNYNFNGCVYQTGGDNRFITPLLLPAGSVIKYLRLYYNDTNASADITSWITRYQPGVTSQDLTLVTSTGSSGYGTSLSPEITHTVDLAGWAYTIIIGPGAFDSSNAFCGVRVAYYAPRFTTIALPVVKKGTP